jgi:hypothetical protein
MQSCQGHIFLSGSDAANGGEKKESAKFVE